jgi:hypothetical protein
MGRAPVFDAVGVVVVFLRQVWGLRAASKDGASPVYERRARDDRTVGDPDERYRAHK